MLNFGLIGVGGYIAPRHLKAIKEMKQPSFIKKILSESKELNEVLGGDYKKVSSFKPEV